MTHDQFKNHLRDYETLGRFLGVASMVADGYMDAEKAAKRIVELRAEHEAFKLEQVSAADPATPR
jgi:hypothetical protein